MRVTTSSVTDDTVGFDELRAVVGAGDGVVARFPGIVCVARCSEPEPLREFLAVCAEVAGPDPGRALARRLATWMSGPDAPGPQLRFGTIAAAEDKLAVYLVGDVEAHVDAVGGLRLSGAHAAIGTDRLLGPSASPVVLSMDGGDVRADPADVHDLRAGVVPGAGVVLRPNGFEPDDLRHAEDGAGGVHEWFDTGEDADDPFAEPSRAPGVPVPRAAGVRVGGRNGVAPDVEPEATASTGPERAAAPGDEADGARGARTDEWAQEQDAGPGRHALDTPGPPLQPRTPRAEPPVAASGEPPGDPLHDPLTDPLPPDFAAGDPLGLDGRDAYGTTPLGRDPVGADGRAVDVPTPGPSQGSGGRSPVGADARGYSASPLSDTAQAGPLPMRAPAEPVAPAPPLEQRRPRPSAAGPPATPPGPAFEEAPRPDALAVPAGRALPAEPAASLFAPARQPTPGALVDRSAGATPPDGFAPPATRAPETRPPPGPPATPSSLFSTQDESAPPDQRRGPRIRGYRCENGHLNDPRSASCRECAAPIDERVGGLVAGPRPALGRLVFDDGAAHVVDGGYLVGGRPDTDDRVRTGELRPIAVADDSVAQAHAEIRVSGWDVMVVDAGSENGTYVSGPDEGQWTALPPRRSRRLLPGTRVRLGERVFVFESSSTVR
jgi:hypothetical protein